MKSFIAATFVAAVAALPSPCPEASTAAAPAVFGGLALRSASPIHFGSINANGLNFWINKNTSTYTPENTITPPKDPATAFSLNSEYETVGLDTTVPGGQQVYVDASAEGKGALKFTQAHSASTGTAGVAKGFSKSEENLLFEGDGFLACPEGEAYKIYAATRAVDAAEDCLGFSFRTSEYTTTEPEAVWQYN